MISRTPQVQARTQVHAWLADRLPVPFTCNRAKTSRFQPIRVPSRAHTFNRQPRVIFLLEEQPIRVHPLEEPVDGHEVSFLNNDCEHASFSCYWVILRESGRQHRSKVFGAARKDVRVGVDDAFAARKLNLII
jgi:hypothetical protein